MNISIYSIVFVIAIMLVFSQGYVFSEELGVNTDSSSNVKKKSEETRSRIIETGNEVLIDGTLRVLEVNAGKSFDLVEISTPATPAANHARIFLTPNGTKQQLSVVWDDGTATRIGGN